MGKVYSPGLLRSLRTRIKGRSTVLALAQDAITVVQVLRDGRVDPEEAKPLADAICHGVRTIIMNAAKARKALDAQEG